MVQSAFSPDDRFFACADTNGAVQLWEIAAGRLRGALRTSTNSVEQLWFPGGLDGVTLTIQRSLEPFRFWDAQENRESEALPGKLQRCRQTLENGLSVSLLLDGQGRAIIESGGLTREGMDDRRSNAARPDRSTVESERTREMLRRVHSWLAAPDGQAIILGGDREITVWSMKTGRRVVTLEGHGGWVTGLALSTDGRTLASASNDGTLKLWNLALRRELLTFPVPISPYSVHLAFAPDGNSVAALSSQEDRLVRLFHAPSMQEIQEAENKPPRPMQDHSIAGTEADAGRVASVLTPSIPR